VGAVINNLDDAIREDALLFGESQSRIILSCDGQSIREIEKIAKRNKTPCRIIGVASGKALKILNGKKELISLPLEKLLKEWSESLKKKIEG